MSDVGTRMRSVMGRSHAVMHRAVFEDERLSYQAVGIHAYIANQSHWVPGWEANVTDITRRHTNGETSVREAIKELIRYGYVNRVQVRAGGRVAYWRLDFYECPELNPHFLPGSEEARDKQYVVERLDPDGETIDLQDREKLDLENLHVEKLDLENRDRNSNNSDLSSDQDQELKDQRSAGAPVTGPGWGDILAGRRGRPMRREQLAASQRGVAAAEVGLKDMAAVIDALASVHKMDAAVQVSDNMLHEIQDLAICLAEQPFLIRTVAQVQALYADWRAAHPGKVVPFKGVLLKWASQLAGEGRLQDGNVVGKPTAASGAKRSSGRRSKTGDDSGVDWTERSRAAQQSYASAGMQPVPEGDIAF